MQARFRIRTAEGQELAPPTLESFSEMVRSGVIRPQDLVFDALTAQWVEAGRHPMVRLLQDPLTADAPPAASLSDLALADVSGPSAEEAEAAFIRRMEEERRLDPERAPLALELPLMTGRLAERGGMAAKGDASASRRRSDPLPTLVAVEPPRPRPSPSPRRWSLLAVAGAPAAALALVAGVVFLRAPESPAATPPSAARVPAPAAARADGETWEQARVGFLRRVAGLQEEAGLAQVPPMWLEGRYLSSAASHPEVRRYWEGVRTLVDSVERGEDELYRDAWLDAAGQLGLTGPLRSLRLAEALEDFAAGAAARREHYRRVREIAASALALHDLLVELGPRVTYQPMRGGGLSADPVLEAAGADPAAQTLLERALDRMLSALRGPDGGSLRDRSLLAAWMAEVPL